MQFTVIVGGWFALLLGSVGADAFLVVVKAAIDVALQVGGDALHARWADAKAKAAASPEA